MEKPAVQDSFHCESLQFQCDGSIWLVNSVNAGVSTDRMWDYFSPHHVKMVASYAVGGMIEMNC